MKHLFYFLFVFVSFGLFASDDKPVSQKVNFELLPDRSYTLPQILNSQDLSFVKNDTLHPSKNKCYWVRIKFNSSADENNEYYLSVTPAVDNTVYYLNYKTGLWESNRSGFLVANGNRHKGLFFRLGNDSVTSIFIKMNLHDFGNKQQNFIPAFNIASSRYINQKEDFMLVSWIVVLIMIVIYFFNIIVDYFVVKEKTHIFYLLGLVGCALYVTTFHKFNNILVDFRLFRYHIISDHVFYSFELSELLNHISLMLIAAGFSYLTSSFLRLNVNLPFWDKLLKRSLFTYLICNAAFLISILFTPFVFISEFNLIANLFIAFIFMLLFVIGVLSFIKRNQYAKLFLVAHAIPFIITVCSALYLALNNYNSYSMLLLPYFGIISFTITFSVALAFRNGNIQNELKIKEIEARTLTIQNEKTTLQNELLSLKNKEIETRLALEEAETENLQLKLDLKNREAVSSALNISGKNETFEKIKKELDVLSTQPEKSEAVNNIKSMIRHNALIENTWENFKIHFEQLHPDFFTELIKKHPNLTQNELRLCAYLKLNLSNKEVAAFQNIDPDSVKKAKMRLKKKLNS